MGLSGGEASRLAVATLLKARIAGGKWRVASRRASLLEAKQARAGVRQGVMVFVWWKTSQNPPLCFAMLREYMIMHYHSWRMHNHAWVMHYHAFSRMDRASFLMWDGEPVAKLFSPLE